MNLELKIDIYKDDIHLNKEYQLPLTPTKLNKHIIEKQSDIDILIKYEQEYDNFLQRNNHILLLKNELDNYLNIRDMLTLKIIELKRERFLNIRRVLNKIKKHKKHKSYIF